MQASTPRRVVKKCKPYLQKNVNNHCPDSKAVPYDKLPTNRVIVPKNISY